MATFKPFSEKMGKNEMQMFLTVTIMNKKETFTQAEMIKLAKSRCLEPDSWWINQMVMETLETLLNQGEIGKTFDNGYYVKAA